MILVKSPSLWSVTVDCFGESGFGRFRLRNDNGVFSFVFLLCEFYNVRMSEAAESICFKILIFSSTIKEYYTHLK